MVMPSSATGAGIGPKMTGAGHKVPKGFERGQLQQFTPEQMGLFQSLFSHLQPGGFLSKLAGGDQGTFDQLEAPALRQLGALQGGLSSRFSGLGTGARHSSGHALAQGQLASDFAQDLQSQRMGLQRQALQDLMMSSNQLLNQRPYDQFLTEKKKPFWKELLSGGILGPLVSGGSAGAVYGLMNRNNSPSGSAATQGASTGSSSSGDMMAMMMKVLPFLL
jgi:hypothetical protein